MMLAIAYTNDTLNNNDTLIKSTSQYIKNIIKRASRNLHQSPDYISIRKG